MNPNKPFVYDRHHGGDRWATLLAGLALLAWPLVRLQADVIDDFEHGRNFTLQGNAGPPEWELVGGELRVSLPEADSWGFLAYKPIYELAEGQPVEFRLDLVSVNASDVFVGLMVHFAGYLWPGTMGGGYGFFVLNNRVVLQKKWTDGETVFFDQSMPSRAGSKTISLTFTREGGDLSIRTQVVLRDDPQTVIYSKEVTDHPGVDVAGDNGPTPSGPAVVVALEVSRTSSLPGAEAVVDNLVCSKDQTPALLGIQRENVTEATLMWPGWYVALESESAQGPWRPCPEPVTLEASHLRSTVRLSALDKYFRLVQGVNVSDSFDSNEGWLTASVVPGGTLRPSWLPRYPESFARIRGEGTHNEDFVLRWNGITGLWYRDCVATVDIIDWGDAMEDATFGILLRAVPEGEQWPNNTGGLPEQRYAGLLTFKKADNLAESALSITGPGGAVLREERFAAVNPDKQYRLRFWAVGDQLTLELFEQDSLAAPIKTLTLTDGRIPQGMDGLYGTKSAGGIYEVFIDQFTLSGATVY